jgi:hypothetical protein
MDAWMQFESLSNTQNSGLHRLPLSGLKQMADTACFFISSNFAVRHRDCLGKSFTFVYV